MDSFFDRLQVVMFARKIKQNDLSVLTGIDTGTISRWKTRGTRPRDSLIREVCQATGCSFDWLKTGNGEPFPADQATNSAAIIATNCRDVNTQSTVDYSSTPSTGITMQVSERERQLLLGLREYFSPAEIRALEQRIDERSKQPLL